MKSAFPKFAISFKVQLLGETPRVAHSLLHVLQLSLLKLNGNMLICLSRWLILFELVCQ